VVQQTDGQDAVPLEPVDFIATWGTEGEVPETARSAFTAWSANVAQTWVSVRVDSVLGVAAARWALAARPEQVAAAMASATAGVIGRWPDYARHESREGSVLDVWTLDPHLIDVVDGELRSALQFLLPPDAGDETRRAVYAALIALAVDRFGARAWRLITRKGRGDPSTTIPLPPSSVRTQGEVSLDLPNGDTRKWKRHTGQRSRSHQGRRKRGRRRKR
jgi:hypothetical protein